MSANLARDSNDVLQEIMYDFLKTYPSPSLTDTLDSENTVVNENKNKPYERRYNDDCSSVLPALGDQIEMFLQKYDICYSRTVRATEHGKHVIFLQ